MDSFELNNKNKGDFYFSNDNSQPAHSVNNKPRTKAPQKKQVKQKGVGSTYMFFLVVGIVSIIVSIYAIFCLNDILAITKTQSNITVSYSQEIESSNDAIDILSKKGLIKCKNFCKFFVKMRDSVITSSRLGGPYAAGVYYLNGKMGLEGMLFTLQGNNATSETVSLLFPEGYTVPEIIKKLDDNDVCDKEALYSVIQTTQYPYSLVTNLKASDSVPYRLEGFLFPDTYEFFIGESASSVIKKFLENGNAKFSEKYQDRAKELGYSTYEIMTIASIIQKEAANDEQMKEISAIIYNRLKNADNSTPQLGCQSTKDYITNKVAPNLSSTASHTSDYYVTYYDTNSTFTGLPAGPICNPGVSAIDAALYPAKSSNKYFFHDNNGKLYTAKTYKEFKEKIARYAPYLM